MKNTSERLIKSIVDLRKKIYTVQEKLDSEIKVRDDDPRKCSRFVTQPSLSISEEERHGKEVVGSAQRYFSTEEIIVCATTHSQPYAISHINNGHNFPYPLSSNECQSIGCRSFLLIVAANKKSDARQIT